MLTFPTTFADTLKREWHVVIDYPTYKRIKASALQLDMKDLIFEPKSEADRALAAKPLQELLEDFDRLIALLYEIFKPECEAKGLTLAQFEAGFGSGEVIMHAARSFSMALYDFFPSSARKAILAEAVLMGQAAVETLMTRAAKELPKTVEMAKTTWNQKIDLDLANLSKRLSAATLASPDGTPTSPAPPTGKCG